MRRRTVKLTEEHLAISQIKKRGWTDALIRQFLGVCDAERVNPHYRTGPPMRLYRRARVIQLESSVEFQAAQQGRKGKREAAAKAVQTKRRLIAEYVASVEIKVPQFAREDIIRRACEHYNGHQMFRRDGGDAFANAQSDPEFINRIVVNFLRHCMTEYEQHLDKISGKVGAADAYLEIKTKVLDAIAEDYDWLATECSNQESRMFAKAVDIPWTAR